MTRTHRWMTALAVACSAGTALAQTGTTTDMYVFKRMNFSNAYGAASPFTAGNPVFIGNNPASGVLLRGNIYMGGAHNGTAGQGIVKVANVFKPLTLSTDFTQLIGGMSLASGRGVFGLDAYRRQLPGGAFESRLLAVTDFPGDTRKMMIFDIESSTPTEIARYIDTDFGISLSTRHFGGGAWDFGYNGLGFEDPAGSGSFVPVPARIDFGVRGPIGYRVFSNPTPPPAFAMDPTEGALVYGVNAYAASGYVGPRLVPDGAGNTQFRDVEFDSRDGTVIAVANNSILVARRDATAGDPNNTSIPKYGTYSAGSPDPYTGSLVTPIRIYGGGWTVGTAGGPANIAGWHVGLTEGYQDANTGDLIFWNDRPSTALTPFTSVVRANRYSDAAAVTVSYKNPDGSAATFASGNGFYDFSWDAEAKVLAIFDFQNRSVYFMSNEQPGSCTLPGNAGCVLLPASVCAASYVGGVAGAPGSVCPSGACCVTGTGNGGVIGTCTFIPQEECFANGNTSNSWTTGGTCSPNPCPQLGSCCDPSTGACTSVISTQCPTTSFFTSGGTCTAGCPVTGSCCVGSTCTITFQAQCTGTWTSGGLCSPNPCAVVTGVCCRGSTCNAAVTQLNCTVTGGTAGAVFVSTATVCNSASNTTPCCYADYNKVGGIAVQDIFDFLNDWFASSPNAQTGGDGTGAPSVQSIFDFLNAWFAGGC